VKRGRRIALVAIASGVAVLGAAAVALREPLLETWWLHRLESEDPGAQRAAAQGLGRIGSLRAIGPLLAKTRNPRDGYVVFDVHAVGSLQRIAQRRGKTAVPHFMAALSAEANPMARAVGTQMLRHLDPAVQAPGPPEGVPLYPFSHDVRFEFEWGEGTSP
jgi:hypothetical protein